MKFQFQLRSFILLSVISGILLSMAVIGFIVYNRLQEAILDGFDKKLSAVSTVTAAFIDARTHERVLAPRVIDALAFDPEGGKLYGVDSSFDEKVLVVIDTSSGGAEKVSDLDVLPVSLAAHPSGELLGIHVDEWGASLIDINPETGTVGGRFPLPDGSRCLAADRASGALFIGGDGLSRVELETGKTTPVAGTEGLTIDEMAFGGEGALIVFDDGRRKFFRLDPATGKYEEREILPSDESDPPVLCGPITGFAAGRDRGTLFAATDRLVRIDPLSSRWDASDSIVGFRSESARNYLQYVEPMREIKARKDLTFLYTQTLSDDAEVRFRGAEREAMKREAVDQIIYVLDANVDDDHSAIGYHDADPADEPIRDVFFKAEPHLSDIEEWERWGLIKSGFAPILDGDGRVVAMAGADVRVEKIREKTKHALVKVGLTAFGALLLAAIVSIFVSKKLTEPIERLKDVALKIAAGDYGAQDKSAKLRELTHLSETFNSMSSTLEESVKGLRETNRRWESDRRDYELVRHVTLRGADLDSYGAWVELLTGGPAHISPTGWTNRGGYVVGWIAEEMPDPVENLRFRTALAGLFYQLMGSGGGDWDLIRATLKSVLGPPVTAEFFLDLKGRRIEYSVRGEPVLWSRSPAGEIQTERITGGGATLLPDHDYVVCSDGDFADRLTGWAAGCGDDLVSALQIELASDNGPETAGGCGIAVKILPGKEGG